MGEKWKRKRDVRGIQCLNTQRTKEKVETAIEKRVTRRLLKNHPLWIFARFPCGAEEEKNQAVENVKRKSAGRLQRADASGGGGRREEKFFDG